LALKFCSSAKNSVPDFPLDDDFRLGRWRAARSTEVSTDLGSAMGVAIEQSKCLHCGQWRRLHMSTNERRREQLTTRIAPQAFEAIARAAVEQRTTPAHVARVLLEDAVRELGRGQTEGRAA
jgi:hypothetical protein